MTPERALCPNLVGREEPLFILEDALLAANRGKSRLVMVGAEAGMGKTRIATELSRRADRLGWEVLWGTCSEAELPVPYLPFVEALGNYLGREGGAQIGSELGPAARELAQLFPQLRTGEGTAPVGDPAQAKLRLFEAIVALLSIPARRHGLLLVVEDVHWADAATRELLDYLARRLQGMRTLLLATYRSDELDRRHPLTRLVAGWRRSGAADLLTLAPLDPDEVGRMIAAILDDADIGLDFRDLMAERTEGNPFVLEEMLKEAIDRGDVFRTGERWQRRSLDELRVPATVRDTILLRFGRLDEGDVEALEAAAVLGRTFEYATLVAVAGTDETTVQRALAAGVTQQLLEEFGETRAVYRWRHALTQEAVAAEIVLPRRQGIHSRAADVLAAAGAPAGDVARHLLAAGRFEDAVPACIAAADEAAASLAFTEAVELLERALPHVRDSAARARLLGRMGTLLWMDGRTAAAQQVLTEGVQALEEAGDELEAARARLVLGRCLWEQSRPAAANAEFERAREVLERHGPSPELAVAYVRLAGLHQFERRPDESLEAAREAIEIARSAGADFERVWATSWLGLALFETERWEEGRRTMDAAFEEAGRRGFTFVEHNIAYNDTWTRLHTMTPGVAERLEAMASKPGHPVITDMIGIATSWVRRTQGDLRGARTAADQAHAAALAGASEKVRWRARVELAEVLLELGQVDEASHVLPRLEERAELQDVVYDAAPQVRVRIALGRRDDAVELAREIAAKAGQLVPYSDTLALAVEAFVAAGLTDEAQAVVDAGRAHPGPVGAVFVDEAEGRLLHARGAHAEARTLLLRVAGEAESRSFRLAAWRARALAAEALAETGSPREAEVELAAVVEEADAAGARLIGDSARAAAERLGLDIPDREAPDSAGAEPELVGVGERLVTVMFADVRGYTALVSTTPPADITERLATLHRWAAAEVERHYGFVDKFAGDAVMATFNATGTRLDHTAQALEAAQALSGKAAMLDLDVGIGIAVGPAVVGRTVEGGNVSVIGTTTNLAARLQSAARAGEILLSEDAYRRVADWTADHGLEALRETLELKGFEGAQPAWRLRAVVPAGERA